MARLKDHSSVTYTCKLCEQSFGDPERLKICVNFEAWMQSVRAHLIVSHRAELEHDLNAKREKLLTTAGVAGEGIKITVRIGDFLVPKYS